MVFRASTKVFILVFARGFELELELVDRATGLVHEAAQIPGHARKLARSEDDQGEEPDNYQFLGTYAEHASFYTLRCPLGTGRLLVLCTGQLPVGRTAM